MNNEMNNGLEKIAGQFTEFMKAASLLGVDLTKKENRSEVEEDFLKKFADFSLSHLIMMMKHKGEDNKS